MGMAAYLEANGRQSFQHQVGKRRSASRIKACAPSRQAADRGRALQAKAHRKGTPAQTIKKVV
jgi:hypothetical protein